MANGNLLEISYDRVTSTIEVELTESNCENYGYVSRNVENEDGTSFIAFYKNGDNEENYIIPEFDENGNAITKILHSYYATHTHIAPPCSQYDFSFADVDKEGSGRNEMTGEMFRERLGSYTMLSVAWDLIPNSKEYNNWYKILTHLPPKVRLKLLTPNGEIQEKEMYRGDISTKLYLFVSDRTIWQGLSTTFTQWNIDKYDDTIEPTLENTTTEETINNIIVIKVSKNGIIKLIQEHNLDEYLNLGWVVVE